MRRRDFLALTVSAAATAIPRVARAQQPRPKRIGVLFITTADDPVTSPRRDALWEGLAKQGWNSGNVLADYGWEANAAPSAQSVARGMLSGVPDVIIPQGSPALVACAGLTKTVPVVFAYASGPAVAGLGIQNYARPGGNVTGFLGIVDSASRAKAVELLRDLAPAATKMALMYSPDAISGGEAAGLNVYRTMTTQRNFELVPYPVRSPSDISAAVARVAADPTVGLVVDGDSYMGANRFHAVAEFAKHRIGAIWGQQYVAADGVLIGCGGDVVAAFRGAGEYAGLVLNGASPADLPIQVSPISVAVNLKTAKALGITIPVSILARADQVIE
jgi:putative ABC transport system substrate-binding protein